MSHDAQPSRTSVRNSPVANRMGPRSRSGRTKASSARGPGGMVGSVMGWGSPVFRNAGPSRGDRLRGCTPSLRAPTWCSCVLPVEVDAPGVTVEVHAPELVHFGGVHLTLALPRERGGEL